MASLKLKGKLTENGIYLTRKDEEYFKFPLESQNIQNKVFIKKCHIKNYQEASYLVGVINLAQERKVMPFKGI